VTHRVGVDPEAAVLGRLVRVHRGAGGQHGRLGGLDVTGPQVEVELLRVRATRPRRRLEVRDLLEGKGGPAVGVLGGQPSTSE
jgi:hypothetical protein